MNGIFRLNRNVVFALWMEESPTYKFVYFHSSVQLVLALASESLAKAASEIQQSARRSLWQGFLRDPHRRGHRPEFEYAIPRAVRHEVVLGAC